MSCLRGVIWLFVGLLFGGCISAAFAKGVPLNYSSVGLNRTVINGTPYVSFPSNSALGISSGVISNVPVTATAGTATASFLANIPLASTAAAAAVTAIRLSPGGLVSGAVASYLLSKGIEYVNGQFNKVVQDQGTAQTAYLCFTSSGVEHCYKTLQAGCAAWETYWSAGYRPFVAQPGNASYPGRFCEFTGPSRPYAGYGQPLNSVQSCYTPDGSPHVNMVAGVCTPHSTSTSIAESDWDAARAEMWPDAANLQLVKAGVALPTDKSVFAPDHVDVALSDPYVDPVTGKRYKDVARVTPQPTTDTAIVDVVKQEVDSNGSPVTENGSPVPPVASDPDLCAKNPGIIACMQGDTPTAPDITANDQTITITPDTGWGPDTGTCPADRVTTLHGGVQHVQSWAPTCQFVSMFRPALLAVAWFSAVLIAVGIYKTYA